jgi:hypothetical protein
MDAATVGTLFCDKNFGVIDIDWSGITPVISLQLRDQENHIRRRASSSPRHVQ